MLLLGFRWVMLMLLRMVLLLVRVVKGVVVLGLPGAAVKMVGRRKGRLLEPVVHVLRRRRMLLLLLVVVGVLLKVVRMMWRMLLVVLCGRLMMVH